MAMEWILRSYGYQLALSSNFFERMVQVNIFTYSNYRLEIMALNFMRALFVRRTHTCRQNTSSLNWPLYADECPAPTKIEGEHCALFQSM